MSDEKCGKCNEPLTGRILKALGKSWHPEHFVCKVCEKPINSSTFNEKDGEPVCSECFLQNYCQVCFHCKQPIQGKIVKALGQAWHENHFVCDGPCKKELSGKEFFVREGKPYCKEDFENIFASRCNGCGQPISDKAIVALDVTWHKDCFTCKRCEKPIAADTFAVEDNKPVCTECI